MLKDKRSRERNARPLSNDALYVLLVLLSGPRPKNRFNPSLYQRLLRDRLVETVFCESEWVRIPRPIEHITLTKDGKRIAERLDPKEFKMPPIKFN